MFYRSIRENEQLSYIFNYPSSPSNNLDNLLTSCDSDSSSLSLQMPRPIRYSWLLYLPENLSQSIIPDLPSLGTFKYYLASVSTTFQKMMPELENIADSIPYAPLHPFSESGIENNEDIFLFNNLLSPLG